LEVEMAHVSVYEEVTRKIIEELEQGTAPWVKPWQGGDVGMPYNATSQRRYSGVNVLLLWGEGFAKGYRHNGWLTFKQARGLGGHVKKGSRGCSIVYASSFTKRETDEASGEEPLKRSSCQYIRFCDIQEQIITFDNYSACPYFSSTAPK
jgi:antirestriction protein ArdC